MTEFLLTDMGAPNSPRIATLLIAALVLAVLVAVCLAYLIGDAVATRRAVRARQLAKTEVPGWVNDGTAPHCPEDCCTSSGDTPGTEWDRDNEEADW